MQCLRRRSFGWNGRYRQSSAGRTVSEKIDARMEAEAYDGGAATHGRIGLENSDKYNSSLFMRARTSRLFTVTLSVWPLVAVMTGPGYLFPMLLMAVYRV